MINVSFNDLAIGSDLPTQRTASRPAEASTFAAMMDDADARRSGNADTTRDRRSETRSNDAGARDAARTERPTLTEAQPDQRDTQNAPARDTQNAPARDTQNAPVRDARKAPASETQNAPAPRDTTTNSQKTDTASSGDKTDTTAGTTQQSTTESSSQQTAADNTAPKSAATVDDTTEQTQTDKNSSDELATASPAPVLVPAAALIQTPAQSAAVTASFGATDTTAPIGAPQATAPAAPQATAGDDILPQTQPQQTAAMPQGTPDMASASDAAPSNNATPPVPDDSAATAAAQASPVATPILSAMPDNGATPTTSGNKAAPVKTGAEASTVAGDKGNVAAATLFAATALAQPVTETANKPQPPVLPQAATTHAAHPEPAVQVPFQAAQQAAPQATSADAVSAKPLVSNQPAENSQPVDSMPRPSSAAAQNPPAAPATIAQRNAATAQAQTTANLANLLGGNQPITVNVSQDTAPAPLKPAPALANGMVAQIGAAAQTTDAKAGASTTAATTLGGVDASTLAQNATPTQTAMAVAAAPAVQPAADEPKPKITATADGLVVNAPAPTTAPHTLNATALDATAAGKPTVPTPPVFDQVAVHVAKAAADGLDKINIKLKPASLGQIEVHLEVASDGRVHAVIAADKPETLDLLQRDARSLERALGDAGLRADSGSLSFNLRGQGQQYGNAGNGFAQYGTGAERNSRNDIALPADNAVRLGAYLNSRAAAGGVDIRV